MGVSYSSIFFPKLNEIINSKISIRIGDHADYSLG
jgi:hypothetical protein